MSLKNTVINAFREQFRVDPQFIIRAPGRVNIIGEHTDYNDGFVLPMAIDRAIWVALRPREDALVRVQMLDDDDPESLHTIDLNQLAKGDPFALEYIRGVAWALLERGLALTGWDGVISGDIPMGAGLSSSAALELAAARAFVADNIEWNPVQMAQICQQAENQWVGVNSGIMDQLISATGQAGKAVLIDCRSLALNPVPLPPDTTLLVLDTNTRRGLVGSKYNERRQQCEDAARFFGVDALRDVSVEQFYSRQDELEEITRKRARHVITENDRTLRAAEAMKNGDAPTLGTLMNESHTSMRDDFEISTDAMNSIVTAAQQHPVCFGARMTGGGFGGSAIALVSSTDIEPFIQSVKEQYQDQTGLTASILICSADDGVSMMSAD